MSSILKALKKLDEERVRQRTDRSDLVQDILRAGSGAEERRSHPWGIALLVAVLLLVGGAGGMLLTSWLRPSVDSEGSVEVTTLREERGPSNGRGVSSQAPVITEALPVVESPAAPVRTAIRDSAEPHAESPDRQALSLPRAEEPEQTAAPRTSLVLSGIVYHADPHARMAVINDLPVMAGTMIEGATVEEILQDHVTIRQAGQRLILRMTPPE